MENTEIEDCIQLKKIMMQRENEWKKDKALYEQKIQLLEIQLEDYRTREINQKKLNDTITSVIDISNPGKAQQRSYSEFQKQIDTQLQNNKKYQETISKLEQQVNNECKTQLRALNELNNEKENQIKDLDLNQQKQQITYEHKIQNLEQEKQSLSTEVAKLKDQNQKMEENFKSKEQMLRLQCEQEIQKFKDTSFKDMQVKQQDYDVRYQQLAQLYEKEKEQLQQRLVKCQNTIKKYQSHIEQNPETEQMQKKYEEQIAALKQEMHEQSVQYQYEKKILSKQIEEQRNNTTNYDSTSKKKSIDMVKFRNSVVSQDSPVQCKSFHISQPDFKQAIILPKQSATQLGKQPSKPIVKPNQSYDKIKPNNHDTLPMPIEDFNIIMSKKMKSQSTNSLPPNNMHINSYLQEASILKEESSELTDEYQNFKISNQQTTRFSNDPEPRRSYSQQGIKQPSVSSITNLSKMLGQTDQSYQKQTTSISTQQKTHNTSFSHFKVPAFTSTQLNNLKHSMYQQQPCTTLRMNENHLNHIQSIKARYLNQEECVQTDHTIQKHNKENHLPSKSVHINNEIKFLIGKLLQAKGKLTTELENTQKSCRYKN